MERLRKPDAESLRMRLLKAEFNGKVPEDLILRKERPLRERLFDRVRESLRPYLRPALAGALVGTIFMLGMESLVQWPDFKLGFNSVSVGVLTGGMVGVWLKYESRRARRIVAGS